MATQLPAPTLQKIRRVGKMLNALAAVSPGLAGKAAFRIFCTPQRLSFRTKDLAFLATAQTATLPFEGRSLRTYIWEGKTADAPTILFLHGWESNAARWYKYIQATLAAGYKVMAVDAPASGHSGGKRLNVLVYSRTVQKIIGAYGAPYAVVGHSLGGAAAIFGLTLLEAQRPERMVVMASFAESTRVIQDFASLLGANKAVLEALYHHIERKSGRPMDEYSVQKKAATLQDVRGLVIHDAQDEVAPVAEGAVIAQAWQAQYLQTEGFGHRLQDKKVIDEVLTFLNMP